MAARTLPPAAVLLVETETERLNSLSSLLIGAGLTARTAQNDTEALSLLVQSTPMLIVIEGGAMTKMTGLETARRIRRRAEYLHVPIILAVAASQISAIVEDYESGSIDYFVRPIGPDQFLSRIRAELAKAKLAQSARIALDVSGTPLLAADRNGRLLWSTPEASKVLARARLRHFTRREDLARLLSGIVAQKVGNAILHESAAGALLASFAGEAGPGEYLIRLSSHSGDRVESVLKDRFELTEREGEVLLWITEGKSNRDIAQILACKPRTVTKHLEQIYAKLRVENRTAAAMLAAKVLS